MSTATFIPDQAEFETLQKNTSLLVVDCTATWCGPCKVIAPFIDQLAENFSDRAEIRKIDVDTNKPFAKQFGIRSIPAVLFFKQGELVETLTGIKTYEEFRTTIEKYL
jgi:thioredoxin 1